MNRTYDGQPGTAVIRAQLLLLLLVVSVYSNTFNAEWHFDDRHSIIDNPKVQISEITIQSLSRAIEHPDSDRLWRPLSYLTFALNWYFGQNNVFGYHLLNILIHLFTALILYHAIRLMHRSPALQDIPVDKTLDISLLAATLWAIHPIQTQAVTYIVQRMTLLAGLWYICGIFCYLMARLANYRRDKYLFSGLCFLSWLLGVASKENAIMLPLGLVLVEAAFFRRRNEVRARKRCLIVFTALGVVIGVFALLLYFGDNPSAILSGYSDRYFTPWERLITQPRVLLFYLSQIVYPHPGRLSIEHDFVISSSLAVPWTTIPAIFVVLGLITVSVVKLGRYPLVCFAVLFFFLNHAIESSIIPLEIIFEHRNYLPSMFLFLPIAAAVVMKLDHCRHRAFVYCLPLCVIIVSVIVSFGSATFFRNLVWADEVTLWSDARKKAPSMHRPVHNLSMALYDINGQIDNALRLYNIADGLKMHKRSHRALLNSNIANIYYRTGRYQQAETYYRKALIITPKNEFFVYRLAETLLRRENFSSALQHVDALIARNSKKSDYLNLKGNILLKQNKPEEALVTFRESLRHNPNQTSAYVNVGRALAAMGRFDQAEKLTKAAIGFEPEKIETYIRLLDIYIKRGDHASAGNLSRFLVGSSTVKDIRLTVEELAKEPHVTKGDADHMLQAITVAFGSANPYRSALDAGK